MLKIHRIDDLRRLIAPWIPSCPVNLTLTDLKIDSKDVKLGDLFIAIEGFKTSGTYYINEAILNGAMAILVDSNKNLFLIKKYNHFKLLPTVYCYELNKNLSSIAGRFYGHPSLLLQLIGVTGTNGKTTITHLLANWVTLLGKKSAVMGTLGNGVLGNITPSDWTTCSAVDVQKILTQFVQNQVKFVAMEVSSHGLAQYRADALYFNVAIFSNLSRDHLDYHVNIEQYKLAKWRLFSKLHVEHFIINIDDSVGYQWLFCLPNAVAVTIRNRLPEYWLGKWISLVKANYSLCGTEIVFNSSWGTGIIHSKLLGEFNVSNILLAFGALLVMGYPLSLLLSNAGFLEPVLGRLEILKSNCYRPTVIIDYAHTPDSLEKVLMFTKQFCRGQIWSIFGCGGDRDTSKRPIMGYIADRYSDYIIITDDNPRTENAESIVKDIISGIRNMKKIRVIQNRIDAIRITISQAQPNDFVLIFGKGHEKYQLIKNFRINYSDHDVIKTFFYKSYYM